MSQEVYTLPIRNWNGGSFRSSLEKTSCLYSTYKELKHVLESSIYIGAARLYSTYKELKHEYVDDVKVENKSLYSTYKELKR